MRRSIEKLGWAALAEPLVPHPEKIQVHQAYLQAAERRKGESQEVFMDKGLRESLRALGDIR